MDSKFNTGPMVEDSKETISMELGMDLVLSIGVMEEDSKEIL